MPCACQSSDEIFWPPDHPDTFVGKVPGNGGSLPSCWADIFLYPPLDPRILCAQSLRLAVDSCICLSEAVDDGSEFQLCSQPPGIHNVSSIFPLADLKHTSSFCLLLFTPL